MIDEHDARERREKSGDVLRTANSERRTALFHILARDRDTPARVGELVTAHGVFETPVFMPVGTQATVKSLTPADLRGAGASIILGNTYHLYLRPGSGLVEQLGGLHGFMAWDHSILTDSGGFQVFSLGHLRQLEEDGVMFRSHIDGSSHRFTPESVVRIQEELGSDIAMILDECTPYPVSESEARASFERTLRWAARARRAHRREDQLLFGIVQGGMYAHLRRESAERTVELGFPGYGIGGLSVGEPKPLFYEMMAVSASALPETSPRYVMGIGAPEDLFEAVSNGVDMFDCVLQTRLGRNGALFTRAGRINIRNARYRDQEGPIDPWCDCETCRTFSLAYLHHLFRAEELLAYRLASLHNLRWTIKLVEEMRREIRAGSFAAHRNQFLADYRPPDAAKRDEQRQKWLVARKLRGGERAGKQMTPLRGILLDIDGTLLLSNDAHAAAWGDAYREFGYAIPAERVQPLIGMGGDKLMATLTPGLSDEEGVGKEISDRRKEIFLEKYAPHLEPAPGARELVLRLKEEGLRLTVATSARDEELDVLLEAAGVKDLIDHQTTSDDAEESKPAPDIVHAALEKSGLGADEVLMLGDTPYDIEAAGKASIGVIALRCGGHPDADLQGALAIFDDPADLLAHLEESPLGRQLARSSSPRR